MESHYYKHSYLSSPINKCNKCISMSEVKRHGQSILPILGISYKYFFFSIFALSAGFQLTKINIGKTGNQNHPDRKVRVVLVTCISNIDYFKAGNQPIMQKWLNTDLSIGFRTDTIILALGLKWCI